MPDDTWTEEDWRSLARAELAIRTHNGRVARKLIGTPKGRFLEEQAYRSLRDQPFSDAVVAGALAMPRGTVASWRHRDRGFAEASDALTEPLETTNTVPLSLEHLGELVDGLQVLAAIWDDESEHPMRSLSTAAMLRHLDRLGPVLIEGRKRRVEKGAEEAKARARWERITSRPRAKASPLPEVRTTQGLVGRRGDVT